MEVRGKRRVKGIPIVVLFLLSTTLSLSACGPKGPVPIRIGEESCAECLMTVSDERYATELITKKGKVYFFDSVECLAGFYLDQDPDDVASMWVTDFHTQARLVPVGEAFFLRSKDLRSPMGMNLTAFGDGIEPETILNSFFGEILDWPEVLALVKEEGTPGAGMGEMHGGHGVGLVEGSGGG
jgi:copper chaperone NosL